MAEQSGVLSAERNNLVDFLRGFAVFNIVLIHIAFWSGTQYVPVWFQSLTLLIDVPLFFFIAGWAFSYSNSFEKSLINVFRTHIKYTVFLVLYTVAIFLFHRVEFSLSSAVNSFFFGFPSEDLLLPVVSGSIWFLPVYYCVSIVVSGLIVLTDRLSPEKSAAVRILRLLTHCCFFCSFFFRSIRKSPEQAESSFSIRFSFCLAISRKTGLS